MKKAVSSLDTAFYYAVIGFFRDIVFIQELDQMLAVGLQIGNNDVL